MTMIKITPFGGLAPKIGKRLLPDTGATYSENVKIQSGELRYLRKPGFQYLPLSPKAASPLSIFKARNGSSASSWFSWPVDVDCVRVPLATDVESRFCWTGDGAPKMAIYTSAVSGAGSNYPLLANELMLGIPTPVVAPTVGKTAGPGAGSTVTRYYCYTFLSQYGEESAPSPISAVLTGKTDDQWDISGMSTAPRNTGVVSSTTRSGSTITAVTSAYNWLRVGDSVVVAGVGTMTEANGTFVVTAVAANGLSFSYVVTAAATGTPGTAGTWTRSTAWNTASMTKNLYRTSGSTGAFQLVNNATIAVATTTYTDTYTDATIAGDDLISTGWEPPPVGMTCLCVHSSGALCGLVNNLMCFSEPLQPHAWPQAYQLSSGYNGVGLATFGSTVVMATSGPPFVATGVEPASMTGEDYKGMYPCLSKNSVISVGDGVLYSSKHGLVAVGTQGVSIFTDPWYTRDEWELLNPSTMQCATANGRVYCTYTSNGSTTTLIFDGPNLTTATPQLTALYADESTGELYIGDSTGISLWDYSGNVVLQGSWRSKEWVFPAPINIGAGKVEFDVAISASDLAITNANIAAIAVANAAYIVNPMTLALAQTLSGGYGDDAYGDMYINGSNIAIPPEAPPSNELSLTLYSGDTVIASRIVTDDKVFRFPAGYKKDHFSVKVTTQCVVKEIRLAETPDGLRQA